MDFSSLRSFLTSLPEEYHIPGASCRVMADHREIFRYDVGVRDFRSGEPMKGNEQFDAYSVTKIVTAVAALQLVERGVLSLTDEIGDVLPAFRRLTLRENGWIKPLDTPLTLADLMGMTSGFDYTSDTLAVQRVLRETGGRATTAQIIDAYAESPLCFRPGTHFCYGIGMDIIAAVIEKKTGQLFETYVSDHIFRPLGMTSSVFHSAEADPDRYISSYDLHGDLSLTVRAHPFRFSEAFVSGGASLITSADDYLLFADALACGGTGANGARILTPMSVDLMRANRLTPAMRAEMPWKQLRGYGYGLGVRTLVDPVMASTYAPVGEFGWDGLKGTYVLIDPSERVCLFFIEQTGSQKEKLHPRLRDLLYLGLHS